MPPQSEMKNQQHRESGNRFSMLDKYSEPSVAMAKAIDEP
jgi:hypothetical protein